MSSHNFLSRKNPFPAAGTVMEKTPLPLTGALVTTVHCASGPTLGERSTSTSAIVCGQAKVTAVPALAAVNATGALMTIVPDKFVIAVVAPFDTLAATLQL